MMAKKCDRCGNLYEYYEGKLNKRTVNGIVPILTDRDDTSYLRREYYDLCPDCMKQFIKWITTKNVIVMPLNIGPLLDKEKNND